MRMEQTDRQTNGHTHHNTSQPHRGRSKTLVQCKTLHTVEKENKNILPFCWLVCTIVSTTAGFICSAMHRQLYCNFTQVYSGQWTEGPKPTLAASGTAPWWASSSIRAAKAGQTETDRETDTSRLLYSCALWTRSTYWYKVKLFSWIQYGTGLVGCRVSRCLSRLSCYE